MNMRFTICLLFFSLLKLSAQENLNKEVIDVVKNFRPKVMSTNKLKSQPLFVDTSKVSESLAYSIRFEEYRVHLSIDSLKAIKQERPLLAPYYQKAVSLGLGTLLNPSLTFDISSGKNTKSMYNAYIDYDASYKNKSEQKDYSKLSIGANYKMLKDDLSVLSELNLSQLRRFNEHSNLFDLSGLYWNNSIYFSDSINGLQPNRIDVNTRLNYRASEKFETALGFKTYHKGTHELLNDWEVENTLMLQKSFDKSYSQWVSKLSSKRNYKQLELDLSVNLDLLNGSFLLLPTVKLKHALINKSLYAYAELGSERSLINWSEIYRSNPYIKKKEIGNEGYLYTPKSTKLLYSRVGLLGNLFKGVNYQVSIEANKHTNYMHYVHMRDYYQADEKWMSAVFTNVKYVGLHTALDVRMSDKNYLWLSAKYGTYSKHLSYVPNFQLELRDNFIYDDKWSLVSALKYIGKRAHLYYVNGQSCYVEEARSISASLDVDIRVNYKYEKQWDLYLELVNLFNEDYVSWNTTPILGRHLNIGASYKF